MQKTKTVRPGYAEKFRCIGPECEDSCCAGWQVEIDSATYDKYHTVSAGPLRTMLDANVERVPVGADGKPSSTFAHIKLLPSLECPFHNAEGLCQIQAELGEAYLSHTCATYPRRTLTIDKLVDKTLTLSCPEACRLVLLNPHLLDSGGAEAHVMHWDDRKNDRSLMTYFWPIREFVIGLIRNRDYPLWQRMFLLGTFSRRLEAIVRGEVEGGFAAMLEGFRAAVKAGSLRASIDTLPADLTLQLGMVVELVKLRSDQAVRAPRLFACLDAFSKGIGYEPEAKLEDMSVAYGAAYERYFAPFFAAHPHMLENYLINTIFRTLSPFNAPTNGKPFGPGTKAEPAKGFALLATDFALIKGVLIGVAGYHKEAFAEEHVVATVQCMVKHFEHNREFVATAHKILVEAQLDNARGLTLLLRN